jgi:hypothetical protein
MIKSNEFNKGNMTFANGVLHVQYNKDIVLDESVLIHEISCRKKLTGSERFFMVLDMTKVADITSEALVFAAKNPCPENVRAIAVITRKGSDHTRAKLYTVFDYPNILTRAFTSMEEAECWFRQLNGLYRQFAA